MAICRSRLVYDSSSFVASEDKSEKIDISELDSLNIGDCVYINKGLYKDVTYYNGLYFDIVSPHFGKVIGSGGRYDSVIKAFNMTSHAFGFALRLHYVERS